MSKQNLLVSSTTKVTFAPYYEFTAFIILKPQLFTI